MAAANATGAAVQWILLHACGPVRTRSRPGTGNAGSGRRGLFVERDAVAELQRPDRRVPREPDAVRVAELLVVLLQAVDVAPFRDAGDLPGVDEHARAHRLVPLEERIEQLGVADDLALAAQRVAVDVLRAERRRLVAAHRAHAAGVEHLEERQRLAAVPVGVADVAAQHQHEIAVDRPEPLDQVVRLVIRKVADRAAPPRRRPLCSSPRVG